ncbi:MAG: sulfite exporter TauE/SafE family protein, partial [Candidatus Thermochlorobacter aerophilum]
MEFLGYFGAFLMGVVLGIMGGGGAILTVPILTYLFNIEA